ncbi:MAG: hypothetical protein MUE37_00980 [Bacteroidales bacterium]|jgi:hypothetical protein|nr:hypothetical protein [Bacteroidales bacterium]
MSNCITLEDLQNDFELRSERSLDRAALLDREIQCYEFILFFNHYRLVQYYGATTSDSFSIRFPEYSYLFDDSEIIKIKKAYDYMVQGATIYEREDKKNENGIIPNSKPIRNNLSGADRSSFLKAQVCYDYLNWLKGINLAMRKYSEKYYAWYHKIKIAIGQAGHLLPGNKQLIISTGTRLYGTKHGFYQAFISFNPERPKSFVEQLSDKDKKNWKRIIIEISGNDIYVRRYLENFPD